MMGSEAAGGVFDVAGGGKERRVVEDVKEII
jgi:hypothetical protein